jgi:tetratricopeptide (TPR) repeat protein/transcriptional regulator with XRE-family HTH domain
LQFRRILGWLARFRRIRGQVVAEVPAAFAGVLRGLRTEAGLTQEELAEAAGLTSRAISYLERGEVATPRKETVRMLADALRLAGPSRADFEATARGRRVSGPAEVAGGMRGLPRDIASFTGRQRELDQLTDAAAGAGGVVSIHAIGGMAGIGKTAFAVHAAHRLADKFPGGQIFLPLNGHTPGQLPADPAEALASLLAAVGVPASRVPSGLEARAALWRDRAAGHRLLVILDDAVSSEQVTPLLPGAGGSLVLVTSRRHLSALEATPVSLDTLRPDEAAVLLVRLAGRSGLTADDPAVAELGHLCGFLPLAIGMVARQLRHHPAWTAAERSAELRSAADRIAVLVTENLSVAAAFDLSYTDLTSDQQRLFRRLGLHPGADIDGYAAAVLAGISLAAAHRGLEDLYDQYLLTEPAPGRYRMHDLIREHARAVAGRIDSSQDQDQAVARLLDYYEHTAARAGALIARQPRPAPAAGDRVVPPAVYQVIDTVQALAWLRAERANLVTCLDLAASTGQHARVIALAAGLSEVMLRDGPWADAIAWHTAAIAAAEQLGNRLAQAGALIDLGILRRLTDDYPAAAQAHEQALSIYRDHGDRLGQGNALNELAAARQMSGDYRAAAGELEQALGIFRQIGNRLGQANALNRLGDVRQHMGDYLAAAQAHEQALGIFRQVGNRLGQANALNRLGEMRHHTGDYLAAADNLEQALGIFRELEDRLGEANALNSLGEVRRQTGDYVAAAKAHEQALGLYRQVGHRLNEAGALGSLGDLRRMTGEYPAAALALEQALDIFRQIGNRLGEAVALGALGELRRMTGDSGAAAQALEQALGIFRQIGYRLGEAEALNEIGSLHRLSGDLALAEACHQQALEIARLIDSSRDEANALAGLGRCAVAAGRTADGEAGLREALAIFRRIGAPDGADVTAELDALSQRSSSAS